MRVNRNLTLDSNGVINHITAKAVSNVESSYLMILSLIKKRKKLKRLIKESNSMNKKVKKQHTNVPIDVQIITLEPLRKK